MKIISKPPSEEVKRRNCVKCNIVVDVAHDDWQTEVDPRERRTYRYWVCPLCGKWNY